MTVRPLRMSLRASLALAVLLAACSVAPPEPSTPPVRSPSGIPSSIPSSTPSQSSAIGTPASTSLGLPAGLDGFAWSRTHVHRDEDFDPVATEVAMGWLGSSVSMTENVDRRDGYVGAFVEGDVVAIGTYTDNSTVFDLRRPDGAELGHVDLQANTASSPRDVLLDPSRSVFYASILLPGGGLDVRRISFDGQTSSTLMTLDARFTPDGMPTERYGYAVGPDGTLVVIACGEEDGCRLWQVVAGQAAERPMRLPKETPIVCYVVGATQDWLVVTDDEVCYADTGDAPLPLRAISLRDGSSRLLANDHILAGRVLEVGGRALVAASLRSNDWSTSDILTIDIESGERRTIVRDLANSPDGLSGWLGPSRVPLVGAWLLIAPWGVDLATGQEPPNARLLDLTTEELIELPPGTFGWD